jgi:hypothetical protein
VTTAKMTPRTAKAVTDFLAPWVIIIAITAAVAVHADAPWHGLVLVAGASLGPILWIKLRVRRGTLTDIHVRERDQRGGVFAALIASVAAVTIGFALTGAPARMTALAATMLAVLLATGAVTAAARFKISMHTAVAAGSVAIAAADFGHRPVVAALIGVFGAAIVVVIGWARVVLRDHTGAQVVAGTVAGAGCAAVVFTALM